MFLDSEEPTATTTDTTNNTTGAPLGESLWKLPNRRFHPEYYELIKKPISMTQIRNKLKKGQYPNITEMTADLYQMIDNAKKAYPSTNKIHKDAAKMQKVLSQKLVDAGNDQEDTEEEDGDDNVSILSGPVTPLPKKKGRPKLNPGVTPGNMSTPMTKGKSGGMSYPAIKKKMLNIAKLLGDFTAEGRHLMGPFLEKPSAKLYPTYYEVIEHPIDMLTIEANIKEDKYHNLDEMVGDFRLMFENCRQFNEDDSEIVLDANTLEKMLDDKLREISVQSLGSMGKTPMKMLKGAQAKKSLTLLENKFRQMHDAVRDYKDLKTGRLICTVFMKLPSKMVSFFY